MKRSDFAVIIPARYQSRRLPGKPLIKIHGKSMISRMYDIASMICDRVIVATDDERIYDHVKAFNRPREIIEAVYSEELFYNGTERCAGTIMTIAENPRIRQVPDCIVNLQCDMPFIHPRLIELVADASIQTNSIATLFYRSENEGEFKDPNNVKVVSDQFGNALYFSRSPIPYQEGGFKFFKKHIGVYAYPTKILKHIGRSSREAYGSENLEQNNWLNSGLRIVLQATATNVDSINSQSDLEKLK